MVSKEKLMQILTELRPDIDFEIGVEDLQPENFNSADTMLALITRLED
jgi:hypothetical protein